MNNFQKLRTSNSAKQTSRKRNVKGLRHRKRKPLTKKAKIWIAVGITLGVFLIAGIVIGVVWFKSHFSYEHKPITSTPEDLGVDTTIEYPDEVTNIALFGIDSRSDNHKGLSDSMMIISIDFSTGSIKLVSIMRDSLVKVEGHGYQKINAAYSLGGPELAIKTLNQTYRLNIKNYATVDFVGMAEIVDAVGGVEVELTKYEIYQVNACITELAQTRGLPMDYVSKAGVQTLNGVQAVAFSRVRMVPTINGTRDDYGRTERQRLVMGQLFQKALQLPFTQYPTLIKSMLPYIETSMGYDDIFALAKILKADSVTLQQNRIPMDDAVISGGFNVPYVGSCVYYDLDFAADLLNAFFFDNITFEDYVAANGIRKNLWYGSTGSGGSSKPSSNTQSSGSSTTTDTLSSSGGAASNDTTDTGTPDNGTSTDTSASESTSLPILPNTSTSTETSTSTSAATGDTTDTGTSSDTEDSGTVSDSSDSAAGSSNFDTDTGSSDAETSDSGNDGE